MNSQEKLLTLAKSHVDNPVISALLLSIREAEIQADQALMLVDNAAKVYRAGMRYASGYSIPLDTSDMVKHAAQASAAMTQMAACFLTLASVLSALGEQVDY